MAAEGGRSDVQVGDRAPQVREGNPALAGDREPRRRTPLRIHVQRACSQASGKWARILGLRLRATGGGEV